SNHLALQYPRFWVLIVDYCAPFGGARSVFEGEACPILDRFFPRVRFRFRIREGIQDKEERLQ
ncbi:hypothetical protein, partial [Tolypothrix sp. VBCCA 56010]|uniref:hypothetical protein n=1 Tax=Tolypothrix sp. VBCCA 56010 TaxID=3137731 RepID=UPI003D7C9831